MGLFSSLFSSKFSPKVLEGARPLSVPEERGLALGAVYAAEGNLPINALTTGYGVRAVQRVLARGWDVKGPGDVDGTYAFLLGEGHRSYYGIVNPAAQQWIAAGRKRKQWAGYGEQAATAAAAAGLDARKAQTWYEGWVGALVSGYLGRIASPPPASIVAWDAARVVHVSRLMVEAGYVDEATAYRAIAQAVELSRPAYASWREFGDAFLIGRAFWCARNVKDLMDREIEEFQRAVEQLVESENSPWRRFAW